MTGSQIILERLAAEHHQHLAYLRGRLGTQLAADEYEDVLQAAYARALDALSGGADRRPQLAGEDAARAWLRTIAVNVAIDEQRRRHGRRPAERERRPRAVPLDTPEGPLPIRDGDVCVEEDALAAVERDDLQSVVLRALETLAPEHRQILKLRYADSLEPPAIMVLERINRRQWEGRHTRALKALARALARMRLSGECDRTRRLLRRNPQALLSPVPAGARDHVSCCPACGAFARACQGAMAAMPLPFAIEAWRYGLLEYLTGPPRPRAAGGASSGGPPSSAPGWTQGLAVITCAAAIAAGIAGLGTRDQRAPARAPSTVPIEREAGASQGARWAVHGGERERLERAAREQARRRQAAARSTSAGR